MRRSLKTSRFWKRLISGVMTVVMLVTILPTAAFAALWDNAPSQNEAILKQLKAFWGDEKTAQEAMELLRQYGLIDEDGNVLTDWSGKIAIREEGRPLTIGEARALSGGEVTVNGHPCAVTELNEALDHLEALGLLVDNVPVADWRLQVDGQSVSPAQLAEVLDSWTAPETPEQPQQPEQPEEPEEPEQPEEPETPEEPEQPEQPTEPEPETPEQPQGGGTADPVESGGILASIGRFFGVGASAQAPAAPVVTVLGQVVDSGEVLEAIAFLEQYGLLTDVGCAADWGMTLPGGERETDVSELLSMLESGDYDPDMVIAVDGTPVTMADFATMMEIQKEIQRIRDTYLKDNVELTPEQAGNLYQLYQQLKTNGIRLYNVNGADALEFPSGINQNAQISVSLSKTEVNGLEGGEVTATYTVTGAAEDQEISFNVSVLPGSAVGRVEAKTYPVTITGNGSDSVTVKVEKLSLKWADDTWHGSQLFYLHATDVKNASFAGGKLSDLRKVAVKNALVNDAAGEALTQQITESTTSSKTVNFDDAAQYFLKHQASHLDWSVMTSGTKADTAYSMREGEGVGWIYNVTYQYLKSGAYIGNTKVVGVEHGFTQRASSLGLDPNKSTSANENFYKTAITNKKGDTLLTLAAGSNKDSPIKGQSESDKELPDALRSASSMRLEAVGHWDDVKTEYESEIGYKAWYASVSSGNIGVTTRIAIKDNQAPTIEKISFPRDVSFPLGSFVPITVEFSELINPASFTMKANGTPLSPQEPSGTMSKRLTFLYEVKSVDEKEIVITERGGGQDVAQHAVVEISSEVRSGNILDTTTLLNAVDASPKAEPGDVTYYPAQADQPERTTATVKVTFDLPDNTDLRNLIVIGSPSDSTVNDVLKGSIDGGETLIDLVMHKDEKGKEKTMTATVEIDAKKLIGQQNFVMEFYTRDQETKDFSQLLFGRYASFSVKPPVPLTADAITVTTPTGWPEEGASVYVNDPPEPETLKWTAEVTGDGYTWTQYSWYSDKPAVADIDANGQVTLYGSGTANFYVKALNGGLYGDPEGTEDDDLTYAKRVGSITVQEGAMPYLRIPEANSSIRSGDPFTLRWASNLVQKNGEFADNASTAFEIKVYRGKDTTGTPEATHTVTYDPNNTSATFPDTDTPMWVESTDENGSKTWTPNQSFVIRGLTDTAPEGYTVTITAKADEKVPGGSADGYTAQTHVVVISKPVSVHLERPARMFVTNGEGTLTIPYTLENYDAQGGGAQFKLVVTNNATGTVVTSLDKPDSVTGGSFTIDLGVEIEDGFRTIYDVSLQAKNTAEPDWSRDSFTLYIYDKNALDILVQPVKRGEITTVGVSGDTITMSNEDWIASLSQGEILALERDIDLQAAISINYGDHAWGEASDRIRWAVDNSGIAAVNYPQGAYYENIEGLPYTSYAPATEFLLSGKNDGKTVVQAIHDLAGDSLSSSVTVNVETLKDKLYLFQFYPAKGGLTMTYTNGNGEVKGADGSIVSDEQGRFAIYEPSGIASDVYVKGEIDKDIYLGTVYHSRLVSQEKDAVSLELYPLNSLTLRKAATLPVYLLDEEGDPFNGDVTVRAGVYRNGTYCAEAKFGSTVDNVKLDGGIDQTIQFTNGKATFYYDLTQFNTNGGADPVTAADDIQFVLELRPGGGTTYYPVLFTASGTTNEADAIRMADRIVALEKVPEGQANQPFVARQAAYFSGGESGPAVDVRNQNGKLGPSSDYPDLLLSTTVLWWGEKIDAQTDAKRSIQYVDSVGITLQGQQVDNVSYPFCSMPVTHSTVHLDQSQLSHLGLKDLSIRTITLQYIDGAGTTAKQEKMRWQLLNALNMDKASESGELVDAMDALLDIMETEGGMSGIGSGFLNLGLQLATSASIDSDFLTLQLAPTQDPTVFRGLVYVGAGFGTDGVSGADGPGNLIETMEVEDESSYDLNYMPGLSDVISVIGDGLVGYGQAASDEVTQAKNARQQLLNSGQRTPVAPGANGQPSTGTGNNKKGQMGANMSLSGYFETEVYYDFNAQEWKMQLVTGGFQAGGSFGYEWSSNFQVGPVPLFLEIGIGMSAKVDFNAAVKM